MKIFKLPDLGEGLQEAELVEWRVKPGDQVVVDSALLAVETAKAVVEIPSPVSARVERLFAREGDIIHIGAPLVGFESAEQEGEDAGTVVGSVETGSQLFDEATSNLRHAGGFIRATPAVRALARKLHVELSMVTPSGEDGVITAADVQRVAGILRDSEPSEPLRGFRRAMAQNMALAQSEVASATIMDDVDIECWRPDEDITVRLIRAVVAACRAEPGLNAWFESGALARRVLKRIDLGVAVDSPDGLFVPVLRNVGERSPEDLRSGINRMRSDLAERRVPPDEMRGATITLSNFGVIAGRYAAPVVMPPTVAILGAGRIRRAPVVAEDVVVARRIIPLSLSFDHRAVSGGEAGRFLAAVISDLAHPM